MADDPVSAQARTVSRREHGEQAYYEISVRGHLGETMRSAFPDLRAEPRGTDTVLGGTLPDRAALYGVLAELEALGLELLEVRRLPAQ